MHTLDLTLLYIYIDLMSEPKSFSQLALVGLVDRMIHLCCINLDYASFYLESLGCTEIGSWRMLVRFASVIMISSHNMSTIRCNAQLWHHTPELWVECAVFYTQLLQFNY